MTTQAATAHGHASMDGIAPELTTGLNRGMAGMVLFIASEIMLFGGLFAAYFYVVNQADAWPPEGIEHTPGTALGALLTVMLITSGFFGHMGITAPQRNWVRQTKPQRPRLVSDGDLANDLHRQLTGGVAKVVDEGPRQVGVYGSTFVMTAHGHDCRPGDAVRVLCGRLARL
jgi:hypothetical protein